MKYLGLPHDADQPVLYEITSNVGLVIVEAFLVWAIEETAEDFMLGLLPNDGEIKFARKYTYKSERFWNGWRFEEKREIEKTLEPIALGDLVVWGPEGYVKFTPPERAVRIEL